MKGRRLYPIGIQTFSEIREGGYVYADKTDLVYRLTHSDSKYIFLSRPRRFGKSLLTSTLRCYFEGRKELFEGLSIEKLEKEWTSHPVLHFDMSTAKHTDKDRLLNELERKLYDYEQIYGRDESAVYTNQRLEGLI
ncbi:AAA family ATPase, partial [Parabacteroides sp. ZJ-118]